MIETFAGFSKTSFKRNYTSALKKVDFMIEIYEFFLYKSIDSLQHNLICTVIFKDFSIRNVKAALFMKT
jgi:hypothetical protein